MDENLNAALNSLDMLATVTNARREYLAERRLHNICSQFSCVPLWRASISNGVPTKENNKVAFENAILCCGPRSRMTEKYSSSRNRPRSRGLPYDIRRKPFHHGYNNSSTTTSTSGTGSTGTRGRTHFPSSSVHYSAAAAAHLFESPHELKSKTEKFPVPHHHLHLFRSKSLEDLRDTSSGAGGVSSKSPASNNTQGLNNLNNFIDFEPRGLNLCHTTSNLNNYNNFKTEIESMSMRIEKLDVA